ncbi:MAG: M18 family aminopeptidase [Pseudomonadota bacterium]
MLPKAFNEGLMNFINASPTPFHATQTMSHALLLAGFTPLYEEEIWHLQPGEKYFVCRNDSALIAFTLGDLPLAETGIRMVGAHTDSPGLKIKPNFANEREGYKGLNVEVYGSPLLNPWFDRELSIAGRVHFRTHHGHVESCLIDIADPVAIIPSLAVHLDRNANNERSINSQIHMIPVTGMVRGEGSRPQGWFDFDEVLFLTAQQQNRNIERILDAELFLYDHQQASIIGLNQEWLVSARIDNLLSCYVGLMALIEAPAHQSNLLVCSDHEEVGSVSACGANGRFLESILNRLGLTSEDLERTLAQSLFISTDNAHGVHPNYLDKHDAQHRPLINQGLVLKMNSNQRYASTSETQALFRDLCHRLDVPVQCFVSRNDMGCGSTIGPLVAARLGVRTLDIGVPTLAMHSIRELAGTVDAHYLYRALTGFFDDDDIPAS